MLSHKFVLFFSGTDYNKLVYSDFEKIDEAKIYYAFSPKNPFAKFIHRVHFSEKLNKICNLPFKSIWYEPLFRIKEFSNGMPLCFVFMYTWANDVRVYNLISYLKKHYPLSKFVCYYTDIVESLSPYAIARYPNAIRQYYDLMISYDDSDAKKYNMYFFPTSFSDIKVEGELELSTCDILFLGAAKNRWDKILDVYHRATEAGLTCNFYIYKLPVELQVELPGIHYIETPMPYIDYLNKVLKCKCVLEIEQLGASGSTLRNWEAVNFNKILLTDNPKIKESKFYDPHYVSIVRENGIFDTDFIKEYKNYLNLMRSEIRPLKLLEFIDSKIR